jgi:hypothetical protein
MSKIIKHTHNRILEVSDDAQQITLPDSRYYRRNGEYYPSITYVLSAYPKGKHFEEWLKNMGRAADYVVKKAAEEGTQTHELIEAYLNGEELHFLDSRGVPQHNTDVWQMFLRFVDFWETYKPKLIEVEAHLFSDELKVAGTTDLVFELNDELWVVDNKTSNNLQTSYDLQTAVYAKCYEECYGKKADRVGILWLKSSKRGPDKSGKKIQGKGWELYESDRSIEENLGIFKSVKLLFDLENPNHSPSFTELRTVVKREL